MIFLTPLLLFLASCVSGTFVVNVTQTSYQAEENQNITLEWTFSSRTDTSLRSISIYCYLDVDDRRYVLFKLYKGDEFPESQQFSGRVQWHKDVLTEGRLTLHVSRLRTNDSGFYFCDISVTPDGSNSRRCWLNVTAAAELQTQRPPESPQPESPQPESPQPESPESPQPESPQPESPQPESPQPERERKHWISVGVVVAAILSVCAAVFKVWLNKSPMIQYSTNTTVELQTLQTV